MLTDNMFVVEVTGITGAAYPPALLRTIAEKLHDHSFVLSHGRPRRLWARYYVDHTLLIKQRPRLRERANALILKGGPTLTVHIENARWQRMRPDRTREPKLSLLLTAQLPVMREAYGRDEEFLKLRTEHPEYYCPTPERAEEQQQEWLAAVERLPGVRIVERKVYDPEALAAELRELIVSSDERHALSATVLRIRSSAIASIAISGRTASERSIFRSNRTRRGSRSGNVFIGWSHEHAQRVSESDRGGLSDVGGQ